MPAGARPRLARAAGVRDVHLGSTGRPKGVVVTHRGAGEPGAAMPAPVRLGAGRRGVLQFAAVSFDASAYELLRCRWLAAGPLVRGAAGGRGPGGAAGGLVPRRRIDRVHAAAALFIAVAGRRAGGAGRRCGAVLAGGEACRRRVRGGAGARAGGRLVNATGRPRRRSCVDHRAGAGRRRAGRSVPIGAADGQHPAVRAGRVAAPGAAGGDRGAVHGRGAGWPAATWAGPG